LLQFAHTHVGMCEDQPGPVSLLHDKIIPRRRIAPRGINY
jgi:hypothetical protein